MGEVETVPVFGDEVKDPEVVTQLRPVLVEAMTKSEPGTINFEIAAHIHDELENYLDMRKAGLHP